jgi:hypothetical protein
MPRLKPLNVPHWASDRRFIVVSKTRVTAAFYVKEKAAAYAERRGYWVLDRGA